ncbi:MAG: response regulator transcription factor [Polaromonas sp.]|uniref:response regulator n=1 Tax=Polaromonas sp. TaxID=1869339 RepID=UPI002731229B|nr:response regulator transcription factor [Polaromonas sp.]MDP1740545.1 response regulator transcription factor [Polaromonas sp.]MDP1954880.1 response regulator transcription factor [Polaromonas sp.]MDP3356815.1 response regulator transcription factor [Polaromonas sp.]MDP3752222.1 response regulator transcription factor [Polaromonas sp.]
MRIFVIDDHPLMREAVVLLIRRLHTKASVTELDRLAAVTGAVEQDGMPDVICLDLKLPDTHGVSGVRELRQQFPDVPIVVLSAAPAEDFRDLSLEAGADVYIEKSAGATEISRVLKSFLDDSSDPEAITDPEKLSKRQKQLLVMLDRGMSNRDIANELQISEHTVKVHLWRLFRRLNVKSRSQASHLARTQGLL